MLRDKIIKTKLLKKGNHIVYEIIKNAVNKAFSQAHITLNCIKFKVVISFCTFKKVFPEIEKLSKQCSSVVPIMSEKSCSTDTRFGKAADFIKQFGDITGSTVACSINEVEPIGPKKLLDALVIAPCTGNTISKIANGIADSAVTLAVKSHLRNNRPVIIAVSTNDGLGGNAKNIGTLLARKNIYFVPFGQDDAVEKENSLVADMNLIIPTIETALSGEQLQPLLI